MLLCVWLAAVHTICTNRFRCDSIRFGCRFLNLSVHKWFQNYMRNNEAIESKIGRPRGFDENAALEAAMRVFWEKSYEGATLSDLTFSMGINRSSMYAAFGDKAALFRRSMERYREGPMGYIRDALEKPVLRDAVASLLHGTVLFLSKPGHPRGCFSVQAALACGVDAEPIQQAMVEWRKAGEQALRKRFVVARRAGQLPKDISPADFARFIATVMAGLAVQAVNGTTHDEMKRTADFVLKAIGLA
jgi:AcrR family transcriptional regulator